MKDTKDTEKISFRERMCHSLDIQPDVFLGGTLIELRGRNSVTLKGCGKVTVYTDTEIRFSAYEGEVKISGRRLCCSSYCKGAAVVDGCIECVSLEETKK